MYLELEFEVAWPYRQFVYQNAEIAATVQRLVFDQGAGDFAPPNAWIALDGDAAVGMYAAIAGSEMIPRRLKQAIAVSRSAPAQRDPSIVDRMRLAASTLLPVAADEHYLSRIAVPKALRGRGFGRAVLSHVLDETARLGLKRCVLDVEPGVAGAIAMYRAAGFQQTKETAVVDPDTGRQLRYARFARDAG